MKDVLLVLAEQLNSSVFVLLILLGVIGWGLFKGGRLVQHFNQHDDRLDKVEDIHSTVIELKTKVDLIYNNTNPRSLVAAHSPLSITELGKELADQIKADAIFAKYEAELLSSLDAKCPADTNAYDIQMTAIDIARLKMPALLTAEELNLLKEAAFNKGILLDDIWPMFGIYLRDKALTKRHLPVMDVDKHDPYSAS